jgi:hypothetical protein
MDTHRLKVKRGENALHAKRNQKRVDKALLILERSKAVK